MIDAAFASKTECFLPIELEAEEYQAAADTVIQLLQVEGELIRTGRAPGGSAVNVDLVLPNLLPRLTHEQPNMIKSGNKYKLCEAKDELRLLAALLKDTQKEHKMIVHSVSDLELQNEDRSIEIAALEAELMSLAVTQSSSEAA